jgi:hypothetical protein
VTDVPLITLLKKNQHIHTIEYTCGTPQLDAPALVCIPGFGFGAALYYAALPALAERWAALVAEQLGHSLLRREVHCECLP